MLTAITCNRYHVVVGYSADFYHDLPTLGTPKSDTRTFADTSFVFTTLTATSRGISYAGHVFDWVTESGAFRLSQLR